MATISKNYMNDIKIIDNLKTKKDYSVFDDERTKRKKADTYTGIVGKSTDEKTFKTPIIKNRIHLKGTKI